MDNRSYLRCGICGCPVRADRLERHVQKQHSIEAEKRKAEDQRRLRMLREQRKVLKKRQEIQAKVEAFIRSNTNPNHMVCKSCGTIVNRKNWAKHIKKCHSGGRASTPTLAPVRPISRERRQHLSKLFGPDLPYSEDIFDRGKVSSGGAYGLGRNRRH